MMPDHPAFVAFEARFGTSDAVEVMERIADANWNSGGDGIVILDKHTINACNHVISGTIEHAGETFGFIVESGDNNGTLIHGWGDPEDVGTYQPEPPTIYTFVPRDNSLRLSRPGLYAVYLLWTKEKWFQEKEHGYNYDRHFAPGGKTEGYYSAWAATKGLTIAVKRPGVPAPAATPEEVAQFQALAQAWDRVEAEGRVVTPVVSA